MKKALSFILVVLMLVSSLTSCGGVIEKMMDSISDSVQATAKAEELLFALAEHRFSEAEALFHPSVSDKTMAAIDEMCYYLYDRLVEDIQLKSVNVRSEIGTNGETVIEDVEYKVKFTDGSETYLNAVYLSDYEGEGFTVFRFFIGLN